MAFVQNEQVACAIMEDEGGNEHTKEKGAMHFNIRKSCILWYASVEENDDTLPAENENGNVRVRHAIGVRMIEEYEPGELSVFKQGQKLKYPRPDISKFNANDYKTYLTADELDFLYNGAMEIANKIDVPERFNWDVFGHLYNAAELEEAEFIE